MRVKKTPGHLPRSLLLVHGMRPLVKEAISRERGGFPLYEEVVSKDVNVDAALETAATFASSAPEASEKNG
jgi:hypothetical protein